MIKEPNNKYYIDLQPLKKIHLYALSGTDPIIYLYIFSSIAIIVLLIACINFMNLSTASLAIRIKEIGLRKIFGAVRRDLIKQFLGESIFLALIALIVAVILVYLFLPIFNNLALKQLKFDILGDYSILIMLIIISLITGLVSGSYPAFYFYSFQPAKVLKGSRYGGYKSNLLRRTLTIIQFTVAIKFLKSTVEKFSPGYPVTYQFLDEYFARQYWKDQRIGNILKHFTFLAIFISCLGLFGLAAFMTARRSKELAIRKVLGASITNVVGILSKEFVILVFCANIIAWPLAYYFMSKWIQNFAFHPGLTLWLFVIAGIIAMVIALFTESYQTLRAAAANPVDKLRNE